MGECEHEWVNDTGGTRCILCGAKWMPAPPPIITNGTDACRPLYERASLGTMETWPIWARRHRVRVYDHKEAGDE